MNRINFIIILIIIISICLLYKHTYKTIEQFSTNKKFTDPINIAADTKQIQDQNAINSSQQQTQTNSTHILQNDTYLKTINGILADKVDVIDSKLSNKLKQFETNEINFHTIADKNNGPGSMNICNTTSGGSTLCSHIAHKDGSTYIRPGKSKSDIWLNKARNINITADDATYVSGKNVTIAAKSGNNICTQSACSHFPWAGDNNTYIRAGSYHNDVTIGEARNINLQANQFIFKNKNGSNPVTVTTDDIVKMKAKNTVVTNTQVIKTGVHKVGRSKSGRVNFNYTFSTSPIVVANIDDALSIPSSHQILNVSTSGFNWMANTDGSPNRAITWIAIGA